MATSGLQRSLACDANQLLYHTSPLIAVGMRLSAALLFFYQALSKRPERARFSASGESASCVVVFRGKRRLSSPSQSTRESCFRHRLVLCPVFDDVSALRAVVWTAPLCRDVFISRARGEGFREKARFERGVSSCLEASASKSKTSLSLSLSLSPSACEGLGTYLSASQLRAGSGCQYFELPHTRQDQPPHLPGFLSRRVCNEEVSLSHLAIPQVIGHLKTILTIGFSILVLGAVTNAKNLVGISIAMLGVIAYTEVKRRMQLGL